jgi:hypothetical protein
MRPQDLGAVEARRFGIEPTGNESIYAAVGEKVTNLFDRQRLGSTLTSVAGSSGKICSDVRSLAGDAESANHHEQLKHNCVVVIHAIDSLSSRKTERMRGAEVILGRPQTSAGSP